MRLPIALLAVLAAFAAQPACAQVVVSETIEETINYAKEIDPHTIQVSLAAPYPGTFLYKQATENGWFDSSNELLTDGGAGTLIHA